MKLLHVVFIAAIFFSCVFQPALAATNTTYTSTVIDNGGYMPFNIFILLLVIAFGSLVAMKYNQEIEVLFGLCSTMSFGIAAWFSAYISETNSFVTTAADGTISITYSTVATPQPIIQVLCGVLFLFAAVYTSYVMFLRKADESLEKKSVRG